MRSIRDARPGDVLAVRCVCDDPPPGRAAAGDADENPERRETLARLAKPNAAAEGGVVIVRALSYRRRGATFKFFFGRDAEGTPPAGRARRDRSPPRPRSSTSARTRPTKPVPRGRKAARSSAPARLPSLLVLSWFDSSRDKTPESAPRGVARGARRVARTRPRLLCTTRRSRPSSISTRRFATRAASCFTDARTTPRPRPRAPGGGRERRTRSSRR